jgi:hypothetical protein
MKILLIKRMLVALMLILSLIDTSFAETISFGVTCSVPRIPGLNAPPYEEQSVDLENAEQLRAAKAEQIMTALENI